MKNIRLSISGLMALVLFMALDFGACKALMESPIGPSQLSDLLVCGALPMANVLAVGLIMLIKSPPDDGGRRSGLLGFGVFGLVAAAIRGIDEASLRRGYFAIDPEASDHSPSQEDFLYTWDNFQQIRDFFERAARDDLAVVFTVDQ